MEDIYNYNIVKPITNHTVNFFLRESKAKSNSTHRSIIINILSNLNDFDTLLRRIYKLNWLYLFDPDAIYTK